MQPCADGRQVSAMETIELIGAHMIAVYNQPWDDHDFDI